MKHLIILALMALKGIAAHAQVTEARQGKEAQKLSVTNGIEVIITKSDTIALKIEAADWETARKVVTKYKGNTLKIYIENPETINATSNIRVYIGQGTFPEIDAARGASVKAFGKWETQTAAINLKTGATFSGNLNVMGLCTVSVASGAGFRGVVHTTQLKTSITGGGFAKITGSAASADIFCNAGALQGGKLVCKKAKIMAQNASAISIQAVEKIQANTDASSAITYYGEPRDADIGENTYAIKRQTGKQTLN
jgi:hypothetical protein